MMVALRSLLLLAVPVVAGEMYTFDPDPFGGYSLRANDGHRTLQVANANCNPVGNARMFCTQATTLGAQSTTNPGEEVGQAVLNLNIECDLDNVNRFNYQRATGCSCFAQVTSTDPDIPDKDCTCVVCPEGFGNAPVSVDCTIDPQQDPALQDPERSPRILSTCTSFDCGFACNGTCNFGCDVVGPECTFCENANAPSAAPTGEGGDPLASSANVASLVSAAVVTLAVTVFA